MLACSTCGLTVNTYLTWYQMRRRDPGARHQLFYFFLWCALVAVAIGCQHLHADLESRWTHR